MGLTIQQTEPKNCLNCGKTIKGRSDKRFCDSECRSAYHNAANRDQTNLMRSTNRILRKNRNVLRDLFDEGRKKVRRTTLQRLGFHPQYFTNLYETNKGVRYSFCYEMGYRDLESGYVAIVVKESYVD